MRENLVGHIKEKQIPSQFRRLEQAISECGEIVNSLHEKLRPIMFDEEPPQVEAAKVPALAAVAHEVCMSVERITSINDRLNSIISRIEI